MTFESLGLKKELVKAVDEKGYTNPSPIQEKAIPLVLEGKDVLASAQTGTGKTAGFTLPMLQLLVQEPQKHKRPIRGIVLTPTRELAAQVYDNVREYSKYVNIKSTVIFGGVNQKPQVRTLQQGVDILIATPGRLLDLINQGHISLRNIEILVLDEADRMLDMGFLRDIRKLLDMMPKKKQSLLFSATFSKEIKKLANSFLHHPVLVEATPENSTAEKVEQRVIKVDQGRKGELVIKLIKEGNWKQVLIFTRTKHGANKLTKKLNAAKISSAAIHGNKSQGARTKALAGFKAGQVRVLVATDIAARGLDIPLLPHVINLELPNVAEDYVHRIGRTGRAGASGEALSLVCIDETSYLNDIEKLLGEKLPSESIEGFEPKDKFQGKPASVQGKRQSQRQNSNRNKNGGKKPSWKKNNSGGSRRRKDSNR